MQKALERNPDAVIVTTEKDAIKLFNSRRIPSEVSSRILYESVDIQFVEDAAEFFAKLDKDIKYYNNAGYIKGC
jgi:tetraacyldisaccharide 4'-kinase